MAVLTIREIGEDRGTEIDESGLVRRTRSWRVTVDDPQTDDYTVINQFTASTGIRRNTPWVSATGNVDLTVRAVSLSATQDFERWKWIVRVVYSSIRGSGGFSPRQDRERSAMIQNPDFGGQQQPHSNPTLRPAVIRFGSQDIEEGLEFDLDNGKPVRNSVGDRFVPPPSRIRTVKIITIERNESVHDPIAMVQYENTVNLSPLTIHAANGLEWLLEPKSTLCKSINSELDIEGGIVFWRVTYTLHYRVDTWILKLVNMGFNVLPLPAREDQKPTPILHALGGTISSPRLISYDAAELERGKLNGVEWKQPMPEPDLLKFNRFYLADLNQLNL